MIIDQGKPGEGVHCAGLHEVVRSTVSWQVRGFHQLDTTAHFGGTFQVVQFLIVDGWYIFSSIYVQSHPFIAPGYIHLTMAFYDRHH